MLIADAMKKRGKAEEPPRKETPKNTPMNKPGELKTDQPLSEKDEVKQAEERLRKAQKKV